MIKILWHFCLLITTSLYFNIAYGVSTDKVDEDQSAQSYKNAYGISPPTDKTDTTPTDNNGNLSLYSNTLDTPQKKEDTSDDVKDILQGDFKNSSSSKSKKSYSEFKTARDLEIEESSDSSLKLLALGSMEEKGFSDFKELKIYLIELISQAKERIYISTDLFGDPDLASSLFVAKFKKIEVIVLLDARQSSNYRSKVSFFLDNGIPVYSRVKNFHTKYRSLLIIDQRMYTYKYSLIQENRDNCLSQR